jgi:hypothetical protein
VDWQYGLENVNKAITALDTAGSFAQAIFSSPGIQGAIVDACLGSVSPELHIAAVKYIDTTKEAARLHAERIAPKKNDIRSKAQECLQRDFAAWQACKEAAQCRGESTSGCGPDPHEVYQPPRY